MSAERLKVSRGPRVILVENDETTRILAEDSLLLAGCEVVLEAGTLGEVFDWARQNQERKADVIVLGDCSPSWLKGRKGRKFDRQIRTELPGVKIVTLSFEKRPIGDKKVSLVSLYQRKVDLGEVVNLVRV